MSKHFITFAPMIKHGTKILTQALISKETLEKIIRETENKSEVNNYINAIAFVIIRLYKTRFFR